MQKTGICQVRRHPRGWEPVETEWHHILPKAMGGADMWTNKIEACALCHDNTHALMYKIAHDIPLPPGHTAEKALAKRALDEWTGTGVVPRGMHDPVTPIGPESVDITYETKPE